MNAGPKLPHWTTPYVFAALMSGMMSFLVSGVATWKNMGMATDFFHLWLVAWGNAWPIAFATLLVVAPLVRRLVAILVQPSPAQSDLRARNGA